jgi:hypothetical protein
MVRWKTAVAEHRRVSPCICWTGLSGLNDVRWCVRSGHEASILTAPFIKCRFVGMKNCHQAGGFRLILVNLCKASEFCFYLIK